MWANLVLALVSVNFRLGLATAIAQYDWGQYDWSDPAVKSVEVLYWPEEPVTRARLTTGTSTLTTTTITTTTPTTTRWLHSVCCLLASFPVFALSCSTHFFF